MLTPGYAGITCLMLNCFFHLAVYSLENTATMNTTISCQKKGRKERTELKKNSILNKNSTYTNISTRNINCYRPVLCNV